MVHPRIFGVVLLHRICCHCGGEEAIAVAHNMESAPGQSRCPFHVPSVLPLTRGQGLPLSVGPIERGERGETSRIALS